MNTLNKNKNKYKNKNKNKNDDNNNNNNNNKNDYKNKKNRQGRGWRRLGFEGRREMGGGWGGGGAPCSITNCPQKENEKKEEPVSFSSVVEV